MFKRPAMVAGSFYPANPGLLREQIDGMLEEGTGSVPGPLHGLLVPHAGIVYSGPVAARAYGLLAKMNLETVVLVGPSHREAFPYSSVLTEGSYETPLGEMRVESDLAGRIRDHGYPAVRESELGHRIARGMGEHSLEVQIPFLQRVLGADVRFVPVVMGSQTPENASALGEAIAEAVRPGERVIAVASSDLSHFHDDRTAREKDALIRKAVASFNLDELWSAIQRREAEACGAGPLAAVMRYCQLRGANHALPLSYATSADAPPGDKSRVVGYLAAAFHEGN